MIKLFEKAIPKDKYFLLLKHKDVEIPYFYTGQINKSPDRYMMFSSWMMAWRFNKSFKDYQIKKIIQSYKELFKQQGMISYSAAPYSVLFYIDDLGDEKPVTDNPDYDLRYNFTFHLL